MADAIIIQIIGWLYLAIGLGILLNQSSYKKIIESVLTNRALMFVITLIAFIPGAAIVYLHNTWSGSLETILVTLIGWVVLLKSATILVFPGFGSWTVRAFKLHKRMTLVGAVVSIIGAVLLFLAI